MSVRMVLTTGRERLAGQWAQPVYRSGYLLVLNSVVTAVLGVGFWLLVARLYPPSVIGLNSTAISAMMFIAAAAQLNLMSSLLRFVPTAGPRAGRMITLSYAVGAGLSAIAATVFLMGMDTWTPALAPLLGRLPVALSFVVTSAAWAVMVMQASVLIALGRAGVTTATNQVFNLLKMLLLFPLVLLLPASGVWFAWATATAVAVLTGGWFLWRRAMAVFLATPPSVPPYFPSLRELVRFAAPDYVAALAWIGCSSLVPIMVLNLSDAAHAAVFALGWSMCLALYGVPAALGQALVAYGVREPARLREHHRKILLACLGLLAPPVAALVLFAPLVLSYFGEWYEDQGAGTVRLLALSALPYAVITLTVSRARVAKRMTTVVTSMVVLCVLVLTLTWWLLPRVGIVGGALAWFIGQTVVATGIGVRHVAGRRSVSRAAREPSESPATAGPEGPGQPDQQPRQGDDGLVVLDLLLTPARLVPALRQALAGGQWLDAFQLSAGLSQLIEDRLHATPFQLGRAASYIRSEGFPWSRRVASALDAAAWVLGRFQQPRRRTRHLIGSRSSVAGLTSTLADLVQDPLAPPPGPEQVHLMAARAEAAAATVQDDVVRLPACFRSFDLHPEDVRRVALAYLERYGAPRSPVCVVGVRTSGSYLAPLCAASLRASGVVEVDVLTYRPGHPFRGWEKEVLRAVAAAGGRVLVTDDPPGSGASLAATVAAVEKAGVPRDKVTLALSLFTDDPALPAPLHGYPAVLQLWHELNVHDRLEASRVRSTLGELLAPRLRIDACRREDRPTVQKVRGHARGRYAVDVTDLDGGEHRRLHVAVEGAGLGYFGRHAVAVASVLRGHTATVYGFADGLLYREWLAPAVEPMDGATSVGVVAGYVARRRRVLAVPADPTPRMRGRDPAWEVAAALVSGAYGPLAPLARSFLLEPLTRRLLEPRQASVVDGATDLARWLPDPDHPGRWLKVEFHQRAFSNLELACYDAVFDLAGAAVGEQPSAELARGLRDAFCRVSGEVVDGERWLLYRLAQLWRMGRAGDLDVETVHRRSANVVHEYLAECHLRDLPRAHGPLCAIDLDGVLETDRLGYPATTPGGTLALRALVAHGFRPVLATGRSLTDARDRCTVFGLDGAVAEYGAVVYDHRRDAWADQRTPHERDLVDRVRKALAREGLEVSPGHQFALRVRLDGGPLPREAMEAIPLLRDPQLHVVHGQGQSDVTISRLDKATGLRALAGMLGGEAEPALAVGDSAADLSMLAMARLARSPRNAATSLGQAGVRRTRGAYQTGLLEACRALLGHRPGSCPTCRTPPLTRRSRALLAVLALPQGGSGALPRRTLGLAFRVAAGHGSADRRDGPGSEIRDGDQGTAAGADEARRTPQ